MAFSADSRTTDQVHIKGISITSTNQINCSTDQRFDFWENGGGISVTLQINRNANVGRKRRCFLAVGRTK